MSERADELAVLRPKPGDVIVIYADVYQIVDAELLSRQMVELRHAGVHVLFVPSDAVVSRLPSADIQRLLDDGLRPLGFRTTPLTDG